jgi:lysozyme family protein
MRENFSRSLAFILGPNIEGGYSFDLGDPGGETKYGISKRTYPHLDIKNLTLDDAKWLYSKDYWNLCNCDSAVQHGVGKALKLCQESDTWQDLLFNRIAYYCRITDKTNDRYLHGWMNRVVALYLEIKKG